MPTSDRPARTSVTVTIRADLASRLDSEADARLIGKALLVEKALAAYLPTLPPVEDGQ